MVHDNGQNILYVVKMKLMRNNTVKDVKKSEKNM